MVDYLNPDDVIGKWQTKAPPNRYRSGYGAKIPTSWLLRLKGGRWHRVYVVQFSNMGSPYILKGGKAFYLGDYNPVA